MRVHTAKKGRGRRCSPDRNPVEDPENKTVLGKRGSGFNNQGDLRRRKSWACRSTYKSSLQNGVYSLHARQYSASAAVLCSKKETEGLGGCNTGKLAVGGGKTM